MITHSAYSPAGVLVELGETHALSLKNLTGDELDFMTFTGLRILRLIGIQGT
jgi:hypothetical protein